MTDLPDQCYNDFIIGTGRGLMEKGSKISRYCGLDLSLVGTGLVIINNQFEIINQSLFSTTPKQITEDRLISITADIEKEISQWCGNEPTIIYIEGLAFGARGQAMLELAALHYFVRIFLYTSHYDYKVIPPTQVKKFVTGKGNAKKELMLLKTYKKWGETFEDNNMCDAYCLARYAIDQENPKP